MANFTATNMLMISTVFLEPWPTLQLLLCFTDRTIAHGVRFRRPAAVASVRVRARSYGFCGEQRGTEEGFSEYFAFPGETFH
jgi:hypothetical protein